VHLINGDPALEEQFALFFDFPGSSQVATTWPRERMHKQSISQLMSSPFRLRPGRVEQMAIPFARMMERLTP